MERTFSLGNSVWVVWSNFQEIPYSRENFRSGRKKINLSIYIPSETSGFLGANSNQLRIHHLEKSTNYIKLLRISTEVVFQLQFAVL